MMMNKAKKGLVKSFAVLLSFVLILVGLPIASASAAGSGSVHVTRGGTYTYEPTIPGAFSYVFDCDGVIGYCLDPNMKAPPTGDYSNVQATTDENLLKALYYGYGGAGFNTKLSGIGMTMKEYMNSQRKSEWGATLLTASGTELHYLLTHRALAYLEGNSSWSKDINSYWQTAVKNVANAMKAAPSINGKISAYIITIGTGYQRLISYTTGIKLQLEKVSGNPELTDGNSCYSLKRAGYYFYVGDEGKAIAEQVKYMDDLDEIKEFTLNAENNSYYVGFAYTDENGYAEGLNRAGDPSLFEMGRDYYAVEVVASEGYGRDRTVHKFTDSGKKTSDGAPIYSFTSVEPPQNDPVGILLTKVGDEGEGLEGAEFTITYYAGLYDTEAEIVQAVEDGVESRSWVFKTDEYGYTRLSDEKNDDGTYKYKVSGDEFYMRDGIITLPLGTVTIQETKAPDGYILDDTLFIRQITSDGYSDSVFTYNAPTITNEPVDTTIDTVAIDVETNSKKSFTSDSTTITDTIKYEGLIPGKEYVIDTVLMVKETGEELVVNGEVVTATKSFTPSSVNGSVKTSITFDSSGLAGKSVVVYETIKTTGGKTVAEHKDINDEDQTVTFEETGLITFARFADGNKTNSVSKETVVIDTVAYSGLSTNTKYYIQGKVVDLETGRGVASVWTDAFIPEASSGTIDVYFEFDSEALGLAGKDCVVYQELCLESTGAVIASHIDKTDQAQTVHFAEPSIATSAKFGDGTKQTFVDTETTIVDTVTYYSLTPNRIYRLTGTLMDKETGEAVLVDGEAVEATTEFTPTTASGTVDVTFTLDSTALKGKDVVVFERLVDLNTSEITATHEDINDEGQTVSFADPSLSTRAWQETWSTNKGYAVPSGNSTLVFVRDDVTFNGLIPGLEYTLKSVLVDKATGEEVSSNTRTIKAKESNFTGNYASASFDVSRTSVSGDSYVWYEYLYYGDKEIASHADINDEGQTIEFTAPKITTEARVTSTDSNVAYAGGETVIIDTVSYDNVMPGVELTVEGTLMDKETRRPLTVNGESVTAETTFTPQSSSGTVDVKFNFDSSELAGKDVVVYEQVFYNNGEKDTRVAAHMDINDAAQTVSFKNPSISTKAKDSVTNGNFAYVNEQTTIVDTVEYTDLIVGREYVISGKLMDKSSGEELLIDDKEVVASATFTPATSSGTVQVSFTLDSSALQGKSVVVFEYLYFGSQEIASHADINDEGQTVTFKNPKVGTTATDKETGNHEGYAGESTTIIDKVEISGLIVGESYTVDGVLMDKSTGAEILIDGNTVTASKTFEAIAESMTVEMEFTFNSSALYDTDVVVFEDLKYKGSTIAYHKDIDDMEQTVTIIGKGDIYVVKTDDSGEPLEGVVFGLYNDEDCTSEAENVYKEACGELTTDENGFVEFTDIRFGTYYLKEIKTVNGYQLLTEPIQVIVDKDGTRYYYGGGELTDRISVINSDGETVEAVSISNNPIPELPLTGGMGIIPFVIGGVALVGLASLFFFKKRKASDTI